MNLHRLPFAESFRTTVPATPSAALPEVVKDAEARAVASERRMTEARDAREHFHDETLAQWRDEQALIVATGQIRGATAVANARATRAYLRGGAKGVVLGIGLGLAAMFVFHGGK